MTTATAPESQAAATAAAVTAAVAGLSASALQQGNPALFAALEQQFSAAGATAERNRILAVQEQSMPGHEKLIQTLMFDGKTTGPEAAVQVLGAHRAALAKAGVDHFADAPTAAASSASATAPGAESMTRDQMVEKAEEHAKANGVEFAVAWKALGFDGK